ncbi:MAG: VOC family protein [Proteobacteria bacterium]|nr:VOC family protein [Pseudomonadota bacterium]
MENSDLWQGFFIQIESQKPQDVVALFERFGFCLTSCSEQSKDDYILTQGSLCLYVKPFVKSSPDLTPRLDSAITRVGIMGAHKSAVPSPFEVAQDLVSPIGLSFFFMDPIAWQTWRNQHLVDQKSDEPLFTHIDHVAINVFESQKEEMGAWCQAHLELSAQDPFHIEGNKTSFTCAPYESRCGAFSVVLSTSQDPHSQISQFLDEAGGAGVQHLAFATNTLHQTLDALRGKGVTFVDVPKAYYDTLVTQGRLAPQDKERFQKAGLLLEKTKGEDAYLAQTFTQNVLGPFFIEVIDRHEKRGFGEGNITALFKAVEESYIKKSA